MENRTKVAAIILLLITMCHLCGNAQAQVTSLKFRIVGYVREADVESGKAATLDFSKVTHINIAFINPDALGNFSALPGLVAFTNLAHKNDVRVLASLGGGLAPVYYSLLLSDNYRNDLIENIVKLVVDYHLDGADIDLEGERVDSNYELFVTGLSVALKRQGKMLTAAIATVYKQQYPDKALEVFDFVNIMSYDKTGPWRPSDPGQHSPYEMAVSDVDYWTNVRRIAKEKISLGVPFYGYGFGPGVPQEISYKSIIDKYPIAELADSARVAEGGTVYYNGIPTIDKKVHLALAKAGGIMIWQLFQDAKGNYSLLNYIYDAVNGVIKQ